MYGNTIKSLEEDFEGLGLGSYIPDKKKITFAEAKKRIFDYLTKAGWKVQIKNTRDAFSDLKVPYAVNPENTVKLWFKSQAMYGVTGNDASRYDIKSAHSITNDIREYADVDMLAVLAKKR